MRTFKNLSLIILSLVFFTACASAQTTGKTAGKKTPSKPDKPKVKPAGEKTASNAPTEYKVLVEGQYSKVDVPFLVVARDAETFALIRTLVDELPASSTIDFTKTAVVAGFAGQRNSGGWTVAIRPIPGKTIVDLREPRKDSMSTQAISYPYQIVLVPVEQMQTLALEATPTWTNRMKIYRISKADFESSGGIAGRVRKFTSAGTVGVLGFGEIVTYQFDLSATENGQPKRLSEFATGVVKSGNIQLTHLNGGAFGDFPHPPLKVFGTESHAKLVFTFESHPPTVSDGYLLRGQVEVAKIK